MRSKTVCRKLPRQIQRQPEVYASNYYEGVVADLIKRARAGGGIYFTGERLRAALLADPKVPSAYGGNLVFNPDGSCRKRAGIFAIKDGKPGFRHFAALA